MPGLKRSFGARYGERRAARTPAKELVLSGDQSRSPDTRRIAPASRESSSPTTMPTCVTIFDGC